ncbi:predicted protein [Chaetoceros tenuissimus]|uniref:Uncharacterized protein n=1 Tax=Chaetoceros tenuissimus TaxID=426638 RepID=A0AAD3H0D4_9STRA|nr:predicted protein [Chaetoceros tenuissimus]
MGNQSSKQEAFYHRPPTPADLKWIQEQPKEKKQSKKSKKKQKKSKSKNKKALQQLQESPQYGIVSHPYQQAHPEQYHDEASSSSEDEDQYIQPKGLFREESVRTLNSNQAMNRPPPFGYHNYSKSNGTRQSLGSLNYSEDGSCAHSNVHADTVTIISSSENAATESSSKENLDPTTKDKKKKLFRFKIKKEDAAQTAKTSPETSYVPPTKIYDNTPICNRLNTRLTPILDVSYQSSTAGYGEDSLENMDTSIMNKSCSNILGELENDGYYGNDSLAVNASQWDASMNYHPSPQLEEESVYTKEGTVKTEEAEDLPNTSCLYSISKEFNRLSMDSSDTNEKKVMAMNQMLDRQHASYVEGETPVRDITMPLANLGECFADLTVNNSTQSKVEDDCDDVEQSYASHLIDVTRAENTHYLSETDTSADESGWNDDEKSDQEEEESEKQEPRFSLEGESFALNEAHVSYSDDDEERKNEDNVDENENYNIEEDSIDDEESNVQELSESSIDESQFNDSNSEVFDELSASTTTSRQAFDELSASTGVFTEQYDELSANTGVSRQQYDDLSASSVDESHTESAKYYENNKALEYDDEISESSVEDEEILENTDMNYRTSEVPQDIEKDHLTTDKMLDILEDDNDDESADNLDELLDENDDEVLTAISEQDKPEGLTRKSSPYPEPSSKVPLASTAMNLLPTMSDDSVSLTTYTLEKDQVSQVAEKSLENAQISSHLTEILPTFSNESVGVDELLDKSNIDVCAEESKAESVTEQYEEVSEKLETVEDELEITESNVLEDIQPTVNKFEDNVEAIERVNTTEMQHISTMQYRNEPVAREYKGPEIGTIIKLVTHVKENSTKDVTESAEEKNIVPVKRHVAFSRQVAKNSAFLFSKEGARLEQPKLSSKVDVERLSILSKAMESRQSLSALQRTSIGTMGSTDNILEQLEKLKLENRQNAMSNSRRASVSLSKVKDKIEVSKYGEDGPHVNKLKKIQKPEKPVKQAYSEIKSKCIAKESPIKKVSESKMSDSQMQCGLKRSSDDAKETDVSESSENTSRLEGHIMNQSLHKSSLKREVSSSSSHDSDDISLTELKERQSAITPFKNPKSPYKRFKKSQRMFESANVNETIATESPLKPKSPYVRFKKHMRMFEQKIAENSQVKGKEARKTPPRKNASASKENLVLTRVTSINGRLRQNRPRSTKKERRLTSGLDSIAPRKPTLVNPIFSKNVFNNITNQSVDEDSRDESHYSLDSSVLQSLGNSKKVEEPSSPYDEHDELSITEENVLDSSGVSQSTEQLESLMNIEDSPTLSIETLDVVSKKPTEVRSAMKKKGHEKNTSFRVSWIHDMEDDTENQASSPQPPLSKNLNMKFAMSDVEDSKKEAPSRISNFNIYSPNRDSLASHSPKFSPKKLSPKLQGRKFGTAVNPSMLNTHSPSITSMNDESEASFSPILQVKNSNAASVVPSKRLNLSPMGRRTPGEKKRWSTDGKVLPAKDWRQLRAEQDTKKKNKNKKIKRLSGALMQVFNN